MSSVTWDQFPVKTPSGAVAPSSYLNERLKASDVLLNCSFESNHGQPSAIFTVKAVSTPCLCRDNSHVQREGISLSFTPCWHLVFLVSLTLISLDARLLEKLQQRLEPFDTNFLYSPNSVRKKVAGNQGSIKFSPWRRTCAIRKSNAMPDYSKN